jgi:carbonic anhydrase/acetyltransferase-like protein (isoleucine patch superfamily)
MPISPLPPALLEVVGKSALQRMIERLRHFGLERVTAISDADSLSANNKGKDDNYIKVEPGRIWRVAESAFNEIAQGGAEFVLVIDLGAYAEIDFDRLIQFHLDRRARISQARLGAKPLQVFCVSTSRRHDAAFLFRSQLGRQRIEGPYFEHRGYLNPLNNARNLRQFAIDILCLRTETQPSGIQIRPGVWMERNVTVERGARVLAPAFIGASAKIRSGAVITRCSSIEHHAQVDSGSVVENSTVLPYCRVGAGLDVAHSVVGDGIYANLRRNVRIQIPDPRLISRVSTTSGQRFVTAALEFAEHIRLQAWRAWFRPTEGEAVRTTDHSPFNRLPSWAAQASDANAAEEFPFNLEAARRYGQE